MADVLISPNNDGTTRQEELEINAQLTPPLATSNTDAYAARQQQSDETPRHTLQTPTPTRLPTHGSHADLRQLKYMYYGSIRTPVDPRWSPIGWAFPSRRPILERSVTHVQKQYVTLWEPSIPCKEVLKDGLELEQQAHPNDVTRPRPNHLDDI
ncbi:995_t:CDS:2 [Acaulospora colombiana]|uniref:995_t:CDS:1 n=1 Tax=Acaulospora colombiana TaxID=27376 RepID=A0ACA9MW22_9GLOM|nr:995_t:CDS:2 [Acaulospora colombiana]